MKKTKIFLISAICLLVFSLCFSIAYIVKAESKKPIEIKYVLQYSDYKMLPGATVSYQGESVRTNNGYVMLKYEGEYVIEYSNKITKLQVYGSIPSATYDFQESLGNAIVGTKYYIPSVKITDFLGNKIDKYNVSILKDDKTLYSENYDYNDYYSFNENGSYILRYSYMSVFGVYDNKDYTIKANDEKVIVMPDFAHTTVYAMEQYNKDEIYGYYLGNKYPVNFYIDDNLVKDDVYSIDTTGIHKLKFESVIDGSKISIEKEIEVNVDISKIFTTVNCKEVGSNLEDLPYKVNYASAPKGVEIITSKSGSSAYYNGIIDLKELKKDDFVTEFIVLNSANASMSNVSVKLTDIYDENNWIKLTWTDSMSGGGVPNARHSYVALDTSTGIHVAHNQNVMHVATFFAQYFPNGIGTFNFHIDYEERQIFLNAMYVYERFLMTDLDNPSYVDSTKLWHGFTDDKCYLSFEFPSVSGNESGIVVISVGGKAIEDCYCDTDSYNDLLLPIEYSESGLPDGVVGYPYAIPELKDSIIRGKINYEYKIYNSQGADVSSKIDSGVFYPTDSGKYTVKYYAKDIYGRDISLEREFNVQTTYPEIDYQINGYKEPKVRSYWSIPDIKLTNGCGSIEKATKIYVNDEEVEMDDAGQIYISEPCSIKLSIKASDYVGYKWEKVFEYTASSNDVIFEIGGVPDYLKIGQVIQTPSFTAFNFALGSGNNSMATKVYINGNVYAQGAKFTVPNTNKVEFKFVADEGLESQKIETYNVIVEDVSDSGSMSQYFNSGNAISTTVSGNQIFSFNNNQQIEFKNVLSADECLIKFGFESDYANCEYFEIIISDYYDDNNYFYLQVNPFNQTHSLVKLNGVDEFYLPGSFGGANYEFSYNGILRILQSNTGIQYKNINRTANHSLFKGFSKNLLTIKFKFYNVSSETRFKIFQLGNQTFGTASYNKGDRIGPQLIFGKNIENYQEIKINSHYEIANCLAQDVLQGVGNIFISLTSPTGKKIITNQVFEFGMGFTASEYGYYLLIYKAIDSCGNETTKRVNVYVVDEILPTIKVDLSSIKGNYKFGESITIPNVEFCDNLSNYTSYIYLRTPESKYIEFKSGSVYKLNEKGNYLLVYYCRDNDSNIVRKAASFVVE